MRYISVLRHVFVFIAIAVILIASVYFFVQMTKDQIHAGSEITLSAHSRYSIKAETKEKVTIQFGSRVPFTLTDQRGKELEPAIFKAEPYWIAGDYYWLENTIDEDTTWSISIKMPNEPVRVHADNASSITLRVITSLFDKLFGGVLTSVGATFVIGCILLITHYKEVERFAMFILAFQDR